MEKTKKVIILQGLARGGSNVVWNLLQSHPNIVSTMCEINEIIGARSSSNILDNIYIKLDKMLLTSSKSRKYFENKFTNFALKNLEDSDNKYKTENIQYTRNDILSATHCFKGVNAPEAWDLNYSSLIKKHYDETYNISLVRNGFSVCEGWIRRGHTAKKAGYFYSKYCEEILSANDKFPNYKIIKFEDVLYDPFSISKSLFSFVSESPTSLDSLRFKVKKTLSETGEHLNTYGEVNKKYWFSKDNINTLLKKDVDQNQINNLSIVNKNIIKREASEVMKHFKYLL